MLEYSANTVVKIVIKLNLAIYKTIKTYTIIDNSKIVNLNY